MKLKKKLVVTLLSVRTSVCQAPFLEIIREKHHHHRYIFDVGHPYYNIKSLPIFFGNKLLNQSDQDSTHEESRNVTTLNFNPSLTEM